MTKLRLLIVDDEPLARERLRALLRNDSAIEIVGECSNGDEALAAIEKNPPDVVFLDVQMPGANGLQVVQKLPPKQRPAIVFATAHDRFAVDAFGVDAVDYLLKPFDRDRLKTALTRAAEHVRQRRAGDLSARLESLLSDSAPAKKPTRLAFKSEGRVVFLKPDEIVWVEAADNYVLLHLADASRLIVRETLTAIEERLGSSDFARVNRSAIVRLDCVRELQPTFHGDYTVILRDGATRLPLSRTQRGQFAKFIAD